MKFTLVTPVLNGAAHLPGVLDSVAAQSHPDWEHIVVDGGSADETCRLVEQRAAEDDRVRLLKAPGSGIYDAIFAGFEAGQGEMLAWINADDRYTPWALATVSRHAARSGAQWITGFPGAWDSEGRLRFVRPFALWPRSFLRRGYFHSEFLGFVQAESTFFSRDLLGRLTADQRRSVLSAKLAGDYRLWRALADHAALSVVPSVLGGFHIHGSNRSVAEQSEYMEEVYATGTWRPPAWLGRRLGKGFQILSTLAAFGRMQADDIELQQELGLVHPD